MDSLSRASEQQHVVFGSGSTILLTPLLVFRAICKGSWTNCLEPRSSTSQSSVLRSRQSTGNNKYEQAKTYLHDIFLQLICSVSYLVIFINILLICLQKKFQKFRQRFYNKKIDNEEIKCNRFFSIRSIKRNLSQFRKPPIGPVGAYVKLKGEWSYGLA